MSDAWKILKKEVIFDGEPWLKLTKETVKLPDGEVVDDFYQIEQPDYVEIVAINCQKKIQGLWHYKHGVKKKHLALPAGYIEKGESPLSAAKRELLEECGLMSNTWENLGEFVLEGNRGPAKAHIFLAEECEISALEKKSDDLEPSEKTWLTLREWLNQIEKGSVAVIGAATAILLYYSTVKSGEKN